MIMFQLTAKWEVLPGGGVTSPLGFQATGVYAGIKRKEKLDLALLHSQVPAVAAGVFTTNRVKAAPLLVTMANVAQGQIQAVVANSGNANAGVGPQGVDAARKMAEETALALGLEPSQVAVASTGVIGVPLPVEKATAGIRAASQALSVNGGSLAAEAIMTTDTFPKEIALRFNLGGREVTIGGMAKGSGMIHPNMATMLAFLTTDAAIAKEVLNQAFRSSVAKSFNMITVDGDTSTNDMAMILANGQAGNQEIVRGTEDFDLFQAALDQVTVHLAKAIARDGEGATKLMEVTVTGAPSQTDARKGAMAIAKSNLVKTAIFGGDANWGRIIAALGYSGAEFDPNLVDIYLGPLQVAANGQALAFDEAQAARILGKDEVKILVELKSGKDEATVWGCDLSYDYVKINGSYRS
ncbi:MAG: bifunctional glutamate N-acetyltransferase/amino-acid acetyltransferase ArgJ [Firmicutes bacterium]|nr:bifunctional glutamate N-acetyltransferase/amino-acid acetyltransferase ArgJ [Bacillota bacterium]